MNNKKVTNILPWILVIMILSMLLAYNMDSNSKAFSYNEFVSKAEDLKFSDVKISVGTTIIDVSGSYLKGSDEKNFTVTVPNTEKNLAWLSKVLDEKSKNKVSVVNANEPNYLFEFMMQLLPILAIGGIAVFMFSKMNAAGGNNKAFEFSKSKARVEGDVKVRFRDVAGCDEEKEEVKEIIDYLKNPKKFSDMGARIPKGILMVGPPGTGKTLLAKAVAGEADVPFFSISGSDFVEMFVGTGASRVRDMFKKAKQTAPCIVFIDEIDAVGRQRGAGMGGGNDEREQTLNQLLVEMDGMNENNGIVIIAATNRPDVLDPALQRSGRFDRQITVNLPDKKGRLEILEVHARNKKLASDVTLESLAKRTPGFSGADLENVLNEGAILAVREDKHIITMDHLDEAIDRVMMGPAKKSKKYSERERRLVAYHEAGHAVIGINLKDADMVQKITIIPRGEAGGYNLMTPREEKMIPTKSDFLAQITGLLGGRVSEEIVFNEISAGAQNDIEKITRIAKAMVKAFGMSSLGPVQYDDNSGNVFLGRDYGKGNDYSGEIAYEIDKEIRHIVNECYMEAKKIISEHRDLLDLIAATLLEEETITAEQINNLVEHGSIYPLDENGNEIKTKPVVEEAVSKEDHVTRIEVVNTAYKGDDPNHIDTEEEIRESFEEAFRKYAKEAEENEKKQ